MFKRGFPWSRKKYDSDEPLIIQGEKVILREKRVTDAAEDYAWRTDEELARLDATRPLTMSYQEYVRYSTEDMNYPSPRSKRLAIDDLDGKHIGNIMYYDLDLKRGETELGIMIGDRDYWSKGYGTDCVVTLLQHLFENLSLNRVYLHTLEWNHRAQRSFAKSGFRPVKPVRRNGHDFILMEVVKEDWENREATGQSELPESQIDVAAPDTHSDIT